MRDNEISVQCLCWRPYAIMKLSHDQIKMSISMIVTHGESLNLISNDYSIHINHIDSRRWNIFIFLVNCQSIVVATV